MREIAVVKPNIKVIAAIPAYNEAKHIANTVYDTKRYADKVIVVDDGSIDNTGRLAKEAGARVVVHKANRGYGGAVQTCLATAMQLKADIVVTLDGDGQHAPSDIDNIIAPIRRQEADIVVGSRFLNDHNKIPFYRKAGICVITWLYNVGSAVRVSDAQSGFRAYSRKALHQLLPLKENGMSISIEILIKARQLGLQVCEVPITCLYHGDGSTLNPVAHGIGVALSTIRQRTHAYNFILPAVAGSAATARRETEQCE
jgi:glycosyltransferase involved in cell wall biosynthesis